MKTNEKINNVTALIFFCTLVLFIGIFTKYAPFDNKITIDELNKAKQFAYADGLLVGGDIYYKDFIEHNIDNEIIIIENKCLEYNFQKEKYFKRFKLVKEDEFKLVRFQFIYGCLSEYSYKITKNIQ
jgi:hypothetical protein